MVALADSTKKMPELRESGRRFGLVLADPPYENEELLALTCEEGLKLRSKEGALVIFSYLEDIRFYPTPPDQICTWVKPISTKNTVKRYSRFVEAISVWHGEFFNQSLHWSARSGVFTDSLVHKTKHPHEKPQSLIEKLILLHLPPGQGILDPFAGSGTIEKVAKRLKVPCLSFEKDPKWSHLWSDA